MAEIACDAAYRCEYPILVLNGGSESDGMLGVWVFVRGELLRLKTGGPDSARPETKIHVSEVGVSMKRSVCFGKACAYTVSRQRIAIGVNKRRRKC